MELLARNGIRTRWQNYRHPVYPQRHGAFVPGLCFLDLLFHLGPQAAGVFRQPDATVTVTPVLDDPP